MFETLLIANRGEIACRVMRTCRRLGIQTVAVYSDADAGARHVREADRAVRIGAAPARESYLDAAALVHAARAQRAQAIHPGYGFLSEKRELIEACHAAGLVFVGPHREAIERMGSKIESKRIARAAGVACVPGYDGDDQSDARLADEARQLGYPLLIKASAGGGGKGMRRVDEHADFARQLAAARGEARAAFGDDRVLLERFIQRPRHLEVQLLGDRYGGLVHLFERECSIQRHYQKLIEEAPAHHLGEAVRAQLFEAALALGRAIGYDSAGTVEFVLDADRPEAPHFLEMNTRLQVEHPVTELTTGLDLVEWQIRVAAGERLPWAQGEIRRQGWAIEARLNAEVPEEGFRASFGPVRAYAEPQADGLRIDSGIDAASEVTPHYDSMLAKAIGHGARRATARERLLAGVRGLHIAGVQTNQALLEAVLMHPAFEAELSTRFLGDAFGDGWRPSPARRAERLAAAAAAWVFGAADPRRDDAPLRALVGFRIAGAPPARVALRVGEGPDARPVQVACLGPGRVRCRVDGAEFGFDRLDEPGEAHRDRRLRMPGGSGLARSHDGEDRRAGFTLWSGTRRYRVSLETESVGVWADGDGLHLAVCTEAQARRAAARAAPAGDEVRADLPGIVTQVMVAAGDAIEAGQPLAVIEAMKLFHTLAAPRSGRVAAVPASAGQTVGQGAVIVALEPADAG